ncbi:MAG: cbb3-type cytochrome c oxidase N-terminal domain-containing protein [Saprospiraceae bacterium]|nr:c-type cytochrome [Saprospiraceae bacterium]MDW8228881.1 cbb3-type cytochrome c oxidase N-terminal domain-containing protein [Saprospiraceae bacterium]
MKPVRNILLLILMAIGEHGWSQAVEGAAGAAGSALFPNIMTMVLVSVAAILFIVAMIYVVRVNQFLYKRVLELEAAKAGVTLPKEAAEAVAAKVQQESFWTRMRKKYWEDPVPIEREAEIMFHHEYDGIRELDNRLPPWWVNLFILTVVWSAIYMFYYHWGGGGPSSTDEYNQEMERAKKEIAIAMAGAANAVDESNVVALKESAALAEGELIFKNLCAACHGQLGEGGVGPNLTDDYWLHGGGIKNVFKVIKYGVPEKGMISWQSQLTPSDMQKVASFILTLHGTNPPNGKDPQGELWKEEPIPQEGSGQTSESTGSIN